MSGALWKIAQPAPAFLGYCYKRLVPRPESIADSRVCDVASVSTCISKRPEAWVDRWDFNAAGYYDTPQAAAAALGATEVVGEPFRLFAYEFFPLRFDAYGGAVDVNIESVFGAGPGGLPSIERPEGLRFLGYDPVQHWAEPHAGKVEAGVHGLVLGGGFGCSPLSCNGRWREHPVNEHCLLSEWADAVIAARQFASTDGAEPGCYYVFGVYLSERESRV